MTRHRRRSAGSLRRTLLAVLLPGMLLVAVVEMLLTWRNVQDAADLAYDRSLFGAVKAIDASISTASGGLAVELPYRLLEFFELAASGRVHYRVSTEDGMVDIGDTALPLLTDLPTGQPRIETRLYFDEPVRLASYARMLERPIGGRSEPQRVVVQVAEPLTARERFKQQMLVRALTRDLLLIGVAALLLLAGVTWALRPLSRLRQEVLARRATDLTPIDAPGIPADVQPLIAALNQHLDRTRERMQAQRRFVDDASHQLRTPLATLATLLGYAQRERDADRRDEALAALKEQLDETVRRTNQMLALARADSAALQLAPLDLRALAEHALRRWWGEAREQGVDLGLDFAEVGFGLQVHGDAGMLGEAIGNLLHNAIRHVPRGGHVTLRLAATRAQARLSVIDDGPGIPAAELGRAGERFFRASNTVGSGSGIGLAVVRSIAERHGGRMEVEAGEADRGLAVTITLPAA